MRAFVEARLPERYKHDPFDSGEHFVQWVFDRYSEEPELRQAAREWASALAERGWVAPTRLDEIENLHLEVRSGRVASNTTTLRRG